MMFSFPLLLFVVLTLLGALVLLRLSLLGLLDGDRHVDGRAAVRKADPEERLGLSLLSGLLGDDQRSHLCGQCALEVPFAKLLLLRLEHLASALGLGALGLELALRDLGLGLESLCLGALGRGERTVTRQAQFFRRAIGVRILRQLDEDELRPVPGQGRAFRHVLPSDEERLQLLEAARALALRQDAALGERFICVCPSLLIGLGLGVVLNLLALVLARTGLTVQRTCVHRFEEPMAGLAGWAAHSLETRLLGGLGLEPRFLLVTRLDHAVCTALLGKPPVFLGALSPESLALRHVLGVAGRAVGGEGVLLRRNERLETVRPATDPHRGHLHLGLAIFGERPSIGMALAAVAVDVTLGGREPLSAGHEFALGTHVHRQSRLFGLDDFRLHLSFGFDELGNTDLVDLLHGREKL